MFRRHETAAVVWFFRRRDLCNSAHVTSSQKDSSETFVTCRRVTAAYSYWRFGRFSFSWGMLASIEFQAVSKKQSYRPSDRRIETYAGRIRPVDSLGAYALITTPTFEKRLDRQTDGRIDTGPLRYSLRYGRGQRDSWRFKQTSLNEKIRAWLDRRMCSTETAAVYI